MNIPYPQYYGKYVACLRESLLETTFTDDQGRSLSHDEGFKILCELSAKVSEYKNKQFICGNGASAAFSNHMALDWTKNGKVTTVSFSSSAILTAVGNDLGYDESFAAPLEWYSESGDLLITISSSGNSSNIIKTIEQARKKGLSIVTLSGLKPDNDSRKLGDLNLYVPAKTYGIVECAHQVLMHVWLDLYMGIEEWKRDIFQDMNVKRFQL